MRPGFLNFALLLFSLTLLPGCAAPEGAAQGAPAGADADSAVFLLVGLYYTLSLTFGLL